MPETRFERSAIGRPPRGGLAPYQFRSHGTHLRHAAHPGVPLAWGTVLIAVPLFWLTAIAWFTRMVF
ncbi:hypothetical protein [Tropicibacter sp. S64]|uniref:hypothetical protein n=1 Tax=Tropicibacter sp. S64 TaxID=3415122 RepID=UPI003C7E4143